MSRYIDADKIQYKNGIVTRLAIEAMPTAEVTALKQTDQTDGDLISRTDLLNKIWQKEYGIDYDGVNLLNIPHIDIIEQMPSAEKMEESGESQDEC